MVGNPIAEEPQEGPRQAQAQEPDLPAVRVTRQHEIPVPLGQVTERARIVQQDDPQRARRARVLEARALEAGLPIAVREVHADDLHRPGRRSSRPGVVDEQVDAVVLERARHDRRRLVIVVAVAGEDPARQRLQRRQRVAQEIRIALRLHREKVAREEDEVRLRRHGALGDAPEPRDRHERTEVRVGDLHDAQRARVPRVAAGVGAEARRSRPPRGARTTRSMSSRCVVSDWRTPIAASAYGSQTPHGCPPNAATSAQGSASRVPAAKNADGQLTRRR